MTSLSLLLFGYVLNLTFTPSPALARPYVLVFVAEEATKQRAFELRRQIKEYDPFRRMSRRDFMVKVVTMKSKEMGCSNQKNVDESIDCNRDAITETAFYGRVNGDAAIALPSVEFRSYANADNRIAFISTTASINTVVHEFMHLLHFADEYDYDPSRDPDQYKQCNQLRKRALNTAVFAAHASYQSNESAKSIHSKNIPWASQIAEGMPITSRGKLGTAVSPDDPSSNTFPLSAGLFEGQTCAELTVWRPFRNTIMRDNVSRDATSYGGMPPLYKKWIARSIGQRIGHTVHLNPPIDSECFSKLPEDSFRKTHELAQFETPLRERLEAFYPKNSTHVPGELLSVAPEVKSIIRRLQNNQACYQTLGILEHPNGDMTFGKPKTQTDDITKRIQSIRFTPISLLLIQIERSLVANEKKCGVGAFKMIASKIEKISRRIGELGDQPILVAASERARGLGETDHAGLTEELSDLPINDLSTKLAKRLLTDDLYERYRKALGVYHFASYTFDCQMRLHEFEKRENERRKTISSE